MEKLKIKLKELSFEDLLNIVRDINSYDSSLDWLDYQDNDEFFFETYFNKIDDAVKSICYGDYSYTDDYVRFNAYGNLESCSEYELERELNQNIDEIVERLIELKNELYIYNDEIENLLDNIKTLEVVGNT